MLQSLQLSGTGKTVALSFAIPSEIFDMIPKAGGGAARHDDFIVEAPPVPPAPPAPPSRHNPTGRNVQNTQRAGSLWAGSSLYVARDRQESIRVLRVFRGLLRVSAAGLAAVAARVYDSAARG